MESCMKIFIVLIIGVLFSNHLFSAQASYDKKLEAEAQVQEKSFHKAAADRAQNTFVAWHEEFPTVNLDDLVELSGPEEEKKANPEEKKTEILNRPKKPVVLIHAVLEKERLKQEALQEARQRLSGDSFAAWLKLYTEYFPQSPLPKNSAQEGSVPSLGRPRSIGSLGPSPARQIPPPPRLVRSGNAVSLGQAGKRPKEKLSTLINRQENKLSK